VTVASAINTYYNNANRSEAVLKILPYLFLFLDLFNIAFSNCLGYVALNDKTICE
jgi:hypothetical protein